MQDQRNGASSWEPPSDALILAATDRAERHSGQETPGVLLSAIAEHLGIDWSSVASRRLRPLIDRLTKAVGWLEHHHVHGLDRWAITPAGLDQLRVALDEGIAGELPESPQHRAWREARARAERRLGVLHANVVAALAELETLAKASPPAPSAAWRARVEPTTKAIEQLALAIEYLHEWPEPGDREADLHPISGRPRRWGVSRLEDGDDVH